MVDRHPDDHIYPFSYDELLHMAFTDELTGLPNYRKFKIHLKEQIYRAKGADSRFAILFMDINNFKNVNDLYGHLMGDRLLTNVASNLSGIANQYSEEVYRKSGDEFLMLIRDTGNIVPIKNEIERTFNKKVLIGDDSIYCAMSIGFSIYPIHGTTENELLEHADQNMYKNKKIRFKANGT